MKKIYVIEEQIDKNTYFVKYELDDIKFAYSLLRAMMEKDVNKNYRLIQILR